MVHISASFYKMNSKPVLVISYDENFNYVLHFGKINLVIRFWNESKKLLDTRYLISEFLLSVNTEQLVGKFVDAVASIDQSKLIQISLDGPNGNLKVLKKIAGQLEERNHQPLIEIGN